MSVQTISYHAFLVEVDWIFTTVNAHVEALGWAVSSHQLSMPRLPRRVGRDVVPFHFAGDMKTLFEYSRFVVDVTDDFVEDIIDAVFMLLLGTPIQRLKRERVPRDWSIIEDRALATIMKAARGRARIELDEWPTTDDVLALIGMSATRLARMGVESREEDGETVWDPNRVKALVARALRDDDINVV